MYPIRDSLKQVDALSFLFQPAGKLYVPEFELEVLIVMKWC
jgi:hypothetical protein